MSMTGSDAGDRTRTWGSKQAADEWQRVAAMRAEFFGPGTERMLDLAATPAGCRCLDVGAGSGDQSRAAAPRAGPAEYVLPTDISAAMLENAASPARQAGLSNVDTRVIDAQRLELDSESFDVVISRFALMLVPDIDKALREIR